ncbi:hypothetical protein BGX23_011348 [Mortierella sp. AD031]|nr:hypothetical protein BGX23_011348 [Mortierella sp. AD031]KAG0219076.1 hypothetical protein BGX33_004883 [Mortierella sp. NVP41]
MSSSFKTPNLTGPNHDSKEERTRRARERREQYQHSQQDKLRRLEVLTEKEKLLLKKAKEDVEAEETDNWQVYKLDENNQVVLRIKHEEPPMSLKMIERQGGVAYKTLA